ncbi:MAG: tetratricopeptide repeat protein [Planctomycetales bacterium]|nr:tetratricopeptide repeat protein [Planctomycetales bacterium]
MANDETDTSNDLIKFGARLLALLAVLLPIGVLATGGLHQSGLWPSAMAPFGLVRVTACYAILSIPFSWWIGRNFARIGRSFWEAGALLSVITGFVVVGSTFAVAQSQLDLSTDPTQRHFVRIGWMLALQLPFAMGSCFLKSSQREATVDATSDGLRFFDLLIAASILLIVPATFTDFVVRRQLTIFQAHNRNLQLRSALDVAQRLNLLGCTQAELPPASPDDGITEQARTLRQVRNNLPMREQLLRQQISEVEQRLLAISPQTSEQEVAMALDHYSLGRFDKARAILSQDSLGTNDEWGALVMGYTCEQERKPDEAAQHYARAIDLESATDSPRPKRLSSAYERLANSLRAARRPQEAEAALRDGLERFPDLHDTLTLQLAEHFLQAGRTQEAHDLYATLADQQNSIGSLARSKMEAIKSNIGFCFIRTEN